MDKTNRQIHKPAPPDHSELEQRVLMLVKTLAHELNPQRQVQASLGSSLQRDLGFDSLGLSELMLRAEKEFKIRLPDDLISRLDTPLNLLDEIARSDTAVDAVIARQTDRLPDVVVDFLPESETTLTGLLQWHVTHNADRPHILLSDGYRETDVITYRDLAERAGRLAANMRVYGVEPGASVGIMLPTGRAFFEAFFGVLFAGAIPVPIYPPMRLSQLEEHLRRQVKILRNCQAALLFVPREGKALASLLAGQIASLRGVLTVEDLQEQDNGLCYVQRQSDDLAMLQYTSGSTGDPKGVMLTHANLLANIRAMGGAIKASSNDVFVSWLPLYHDLGLIGAWFGSLYYAVPAIIMSPLRFIVRPESWLWAIHRNSASLSAAPNFAFELCVNKIDESALNGLDLSSLRMVANGAEPVSAETIQRFTDRFRPYGFKPEAMAPVYGLAENSVGLAFSAIGEKPIVDRINRKSLSQTGMAVPANPDDEQPMSFVSSGVPLPGHDIRIVDDLGREAAERQQGRLEFRGASATSGYFRNPERSRALIRDSWLDSSDLAYIAKGNVFITGRVKDIIIKGGRNIYPEEIEEIVGNIAGIRKGCVAAFASPDPKTGSERLIVVAETRSTDPAELLKLQRIVAESVSDILGMPADQVIVTQPHAIPKTSSGKIRRSTTRDLFETAKLGEPVRAVWLQVLRLRLRSTASQIQRFMKAAADLAYACWWWIVLVTLSAATWPLVLLLSQRKHRWDFIRLMARTALRLMRIPITVSGEEQFARQPGLIVVNHSSYVDALVLAAILPGEPVFVAKKELAGQFVAGPFLRKLGARFAERAVVEEGLKEVESFKDLVRRGEQLVFFPEATFFRIPGLLPFRLGAFAIACVAGSAVLPIAISGTRSVLRGEQWFPRRGSVRVNVLKPISPQGQDFSAAVRLRNKARAAILTHCGEPDMGEKVVVFAEDSDEQSNE
ncbi:MAG: AMP-binding protein [Rhodobacteraceae bacterium]|nr:AMP-binding protein [Paracoccaceae bacterium]